MRKNNYYQNKNNSYPIKENHLRGKSGSPRITEQIIGSTSWRLKL